MKASEITSKQIIILFILFLIFFGVTSVSFLSWYYIKTIEDRNLIEKEKIEADNRLAAQETSKLEEKETNRKLDLSACLSITSIEYSQNWDTACKSQYDARERDFAYCISTGIFGSTNESYCKQIHPPVKDADCSLTTDAANRLDSIKKESEDRCYQLYKE